MFQLRWRWPILALLITGLTYVANHYTIGGIEHLRLKPRPSATVTERFGSVGGGSNYWDPSIFASAAQSGYPPTNFPATNFPASNFPSTQQASETLPASPFPRTENPLSDAGWSGDLTVGEKLAMLQDKISSPSSSIDPVVSSPSFLSSPIPVPPGFATAHTSGNLPATNTFRDDQVDESSRIKLAFGGRAISDSKRGIRIASFNTQSLGPAKMAKPHAFESIISMIRQFDVIALQEVQSSRDDILPIIVDRLNLSGRRFDYVVGPRVGRLNSKMQYAIVFDTERVETDRFQLYTVDDPEDLMSYEPLVAWFRCKQVPEKDAFTFSLINIAIDPNLASSERAMLPGLIEAVRTDGRNEDDWIIAGDVGCGVVELAELEQNAVRFAIRDIPTNVDGTKSLDSIFFSSMATTEFTGRAGAFDFLRKFNLSIERALEISDHLPVWAEFSVVEGAEPGRVAPIDPQSIY